MFWSGEQETQSATERAFGLHLIGSDLAKMKTGTAASIHRGIVLHLWVLPGALQQPEDIYVCQR